MGGTASGLMGEVRGFPHALTSFVGREDETGKVARLLDEYRMVTVTGPGGVDGEGTCRRASAASSDPAAGGAPTHRSLSSYSSA
jgi:hypothetical protein